MIRPDASKVRKPKFNRFDRYRDLYRRAITPTELDIEDLKMLGIYVEIDAL